MGEKDGNCVFLPGMMRFINQAEYGLTELYLSVLLKSRVATPCHDIVLLTKLYVS